MKKSVYFKLQLKRAFKHYPSVLLVTLISIFGIIATVTTLFYVNNNSRDKQKINIGIVGNIADSDIDIVVYALENIEEAIPSVNFLELSEDEAKQALNKNEIVGYINIPEGYFEDLAYGENSAAKYVSAGNRGDLGSVLANEMAIMLSDMVLQTQRGMYSAVEIAEDYGVKKGIYRKIDDLNFEYMGFVLNRQQTYDVEYLGIKDHLTYGGYYICGFFIFFLMIWGISCTKILSSSNYGLSRSLYARGMKGREQVLCEYSGYLVISLVTFFFLFFIFGFFMEFVNFEIRELAGASIFFGVGFVFKMIPVILLFTLMHFMLYEIFNNIVSSVLVQFIVAMGMGYISGCFYPNTFFPEAVQKTASYLPSGASFSYAGKVLTDGALGGEVAVIFTYIVLFALITVGVRTYKLKEDGTR